MEAQELAHQIVVVFVLIGFTIWSFTGKPGEGENTFRGDL